MKLSSLHESTICVHTSYQMEYAKKGYALSFIHTLSICVKKEVYFELELMGKSLSSGVHHQAIQQIKYRAFTIYTHEF